MGSKTYKVRCIVLNKTKLREKDLIVTMLDESGRLVRGVAKGARKPGGAFAGRLELFSLVDVMLAEGRSLDVVCEARLVGMTSQAPHKLEQSACCALLAELLGNVSQPDLPQPRVFEISKAAFERMLDAHAASRDALVVSAASLWKVVSQAGFRPSFSRCVLCDADVDDVDGLIALSVAEGGVTCGSCRRPADAILVDANVVRWCDALIGMRFDELLLSSMDINTCFSTLQLVRQWARAHTGRDLKSLDFLVASGIFEEEASHPAVG